MMDQPELGKKIAHCRKARGWTQEELVERCNLSVRTLQRIEAGEVTPRFYTTRLIFEALELSYEESAGALKKDSGRFKKWPGQFYIAFIDLFNLKTNTMRKISILSIGIFLAVLGISSFSGLTVAQSDAKVRKIIENTNEDFMKWFNEGNFDALAKLYMPDACLISRGCGRDFIREYYKAESALYRFTEIRMTDLSVSDSIAVEKGKWTILLNSGIPVGGEYLSEWRLTGKKWMIVSESSTPGNN